MPCDKTCKRRVLTLGSDHQEESWRSIKTNHYHRALTGYHSSNIVCGRCINGVLYYQASIGHDGRVIMRFNVKSEILDMIVLPSWGENVWRMEMISYEGKLAFVDINENSITIWVLEDAEKREWLNHFFSPLRRYNNQLKLVGITDDSELIFVSKAILKSFDIIYIDPKRGTFRSVTYKGILDYDFGQRNGFGVNYVPLSLLQFFPNHIEISLSF